MEPLLRQGRKMVCCGVEYSVRGLRHASALQLREGVLEETRSYAAELPAGQPRPQAQTRRISGKTSHGSTLQPTRQEYGGSWRLALLCIPSARLRLNELHSRRISGFPPKRENHRPGLMSTLVGAFTASTGVGMGVGVAVALGSARFGSPCRWPPGAPHHPFSEGLFRRGLAAVALRSAWPRSP